MYGGRTAGMFGYSHFMGGFAGGQAEYVRVPLGDVNLLKLPDSVPDEKGVFVFFLLTFREFCPPLDFLFFFNCRVSVTSQLQIVLIRCTDSKGNRRLE